METLNQILEITVYVAGGAAVLGTIIWMTKIFGNRRKMDKSADALKEDLDSRLDDIKDLREGKKPRSTPKIQYKKKI